MLKVVGKRYPISPVKKPIAQQPITIFNESSLDLVNKLGIKNKANTNHMAPPAIACLNLSFIFRSNVTDFFSVIAFRPS